MSGLETATGGRNGAFPRSWGIPPGDADSEQRAAWVKARVREHQQTEPRRAAERRLSELRARDERMLMAARVRRRELENERVALQARRAELLARRYGPT